MPHQVFNDPYFDQVSGQWFTPIEPDQGYLTPEQAMQSAMACVPTDERQ